MASRREDGIEQYYLEVDIEMSYQRIKEVEEFMINFDEKRFKNVGEVLLFSDAWVLVDSIKGCIELALKEKTLTPEKVGGAF